jgi:hypothetical protein
MAMKYESTFMIFRDAMGRPLKVLIEQGVLSMKEDKN